MEQVDRALVFAAQKHSGQVRDGDHALPYLTHPVDVLGKLRYVGLVTDEDMLTAAVLHDTMEECGVKEGTIGRMFGPKVQSLVKQLTRTEPTATEVAGLTKKQIWELRSLILLHEIKTEMGPEAQAIKLADRLSNLEEALRTRTGEKLERYMRQSRSILGIIPAEVNAPLWSSIDRILSERGD